MIALSFKNVLVFIQFMHDYTQTTRTVKQNCKSLFPGFCKLYDHFGEYKMHTHHTHICNELIHVVYANLHMYNIGDCCGQGVELGIFMFPAKYSFFT